MQKLGIKETEEAFVGVMELSLFLIQQLKDGAQTSDFFAIWEKWRDDEQFRVLIQTAYDGIQQVPAEMDDISLEETIKLVTLVAAYIPRLVDQFRA